MLILLIIAPCVTNRVTTLTGNYLDLASYISVPAEMQEETTKVEKISTKRARLLKAPNILLVIGCITVYLSYSGWLSLSLPSAAVSAIFGLYIAFKHIRELELGSKLGKAKSPWARVFLFMLSGYIYFSIIGYGVIYPIHALLGKKTSETLIASAKHQGAGRPLCSWFLSLKISDKNTDSYCVSKRIYNAYAKSRDVLSLRESDYAGVVIKRSFLGTSLVSVEYLEWKSLEGKTVRAEL